MSKDDYEKLLDQYQKLVNNHDLTYTYSDDHSVYTRGLQQYNKIKEMEKQIDPEDVKRIWNHIVDLRISPRFRKDFYIE